MYIVFSTDRGDLELELRQDHPDAVVADLLEALVPAPTQSAEADAASPDRTLCVDGRPVAADLTLVEAGLVDGAIITVANVDDLLGCRHQSAGDGQASAEASWEFVVVGGLASGRRHHLRVGRTLVGRSGKADIVVADPTVSSLHLEMTVAPGQLSVSDLGSHNGTRIDDQVVRRDVDLKPGQLVRFGAAEAVVRQMDCDDRPAGLDTTRLAVAGKLPFNRPPRPALAPEVAPVVVPDPPVDKKRAAAFSVAAMLGPIIMGVVMVQLLGNIRYALFALMSPVMLITNTIGTRRRNTKDSKTSLREFKAALATFEDALEAASVEERNRREALSPDAGEIIRRAGLPSTRLWERRHTHADYLRLRVGRGPVRWAPPADMGRVGANPELAATIDRASTIERCAVHVDLADGNVVGLVGDRAAALALARSLVVQTCVLHGPADTALMVLTDQMNAPDWDWSKWLPHATSPTSRGRYLSTDAATSHDLMEQLIAAADRDAGRRKIGVAHEPAAGPAVLVVVDDESVTVGRRSPTRAVLRGVAGAATGIVIAASADRLPSVCTTIVHLKDDLGDADVHRPQLAERTGDVVVAGMDDATARSAARQLARYEDPELGAMGNSIPAVVNLVSLLGLDDPTGVSAQSVLAQWRRAGVDPAPGAPVGLCGDGVFELDLVADGPHGLVGGTTGSGKSEFLRSFVAAMATRLSPNDLVFVLVDYKGGSAFDECARLPHTVGMVTDLDEHLGERALRSLEAELHRREQTLRNAGAVDLPEYLRMGAPAGPLPRLVVVVDEFATLAAELPDFMGALVGIAQRGRSLGVHMILATQRPSGAVNANIKANTNMRVALRVQDAHDSADVIDRPDAAEIARSTPGRAYVRLGPSEVVLVQTALSTSSSNVEAHGAVACAPFRFGPVSSAGLQEPAGDGPSDLVRLVEACREAFDDSGMSLPRRPWLEMLGTELALADVAGDESLAHDDAPDPDIVPIALADDPDRQRRRPVLWSMADGHLALFGAVGSGTTSALLATVLMAVRRASPDELHVYALDFGGGSLAVLRDLPHVGAVVAANERERQVRLVAMLAADVVRRRGMPSADRSREPQTILVVDGLPALLAEFEGMEGQDTVDALKRVLAEGPGVGVVLALTADRPMAVSMRLLSSVTRRLLFKHGDPGDFSTIGMRPKDLPAFVPGRAIDGESRLVVQVPWVQDPRAEVDALVEVSGVPLRPPARVDVMPTAVTMGQLAGHVSAGETLRLPVGIAERDRTVATVELYPGEHLLVAGQARSGVSTTLRMFGRLVANACPDAVMVAVADERSPLRSETEIFDGLGTIDELQHILEVAAHGDGRDWVVVVDDAHCIDDPGALAAVVAAGERCRVIVGGRADQLHGHFGHWTRRVRRSGAGLLLQPRLDADGDLLGVRLPRRLGVPMLPGRGFIVSRGDVALVQVGGIDLVAA